jgi:hypothetical protein
VNSHFGVRRFEGAEEFMSELEDDEVTSGALVARWSQTPLTIFGFCGLENRELGIRIHEIVKCEILKRRKFRCGANI